MEDVEGDHLRVDKGIFPLHSVDEIRGEHLRFDKRIFPFHSKYKIIFVYQRD
jgi:hypothetical protein